MQKWINGLASDETVEPCRWRRETGHSLVSKKLIGVGLPLGITSVNFSSERMTQRACTGNASLWLSKNEMCRRTHLGSRKLKKACLHKGVKPFVTQSCKFEPLPLSTRSELRDWRTAHFLARLSLEVTDRYYFSRKKTNAVERILSTDNTFGEYSPAWDRHFGLCFFSLTNPVDRFSFSSCLLESIRMGSEGCGTDPTANVCYKKQ